MQANTRSPPGALEATYGKVRGCPYIEKVYLVYRRGSADDRIDGDENETWSSNHHALPTPITSGGFCPLCSCTRVFLLNHKMMVLMPNPDPNPTHFHPHRATLGAPMAEAHRPCSLLGRQSRTSGARKRKNMIHNRRTSKWSKTVRARITRPGQKRTRSRTRREKRA